jgi:hypothetical protein
LRRRALVAGAGAFAAFVVCGCGGGPLSIGDLRAQATRECLNAQVQTSRIPTPTSPAAADGFLRQGVRVLSPELVALRALKPPSGVADVYSTALLAFSHKLGELNGTVSGLEQGADPVGAMHALQHRLAPIESAEDGAWQTLQIPACLNR